MRKGKKNEGNFREIIDSLINDIQSSEKGRRENRTIF